MINPADEKLLITFLDRGFHKFSFYLKRDYQGHILWSDPTNIRQCMCSILEAYEDLQEFQDQLNNAGQIINKLASQYGISTDSEKTHA